MFRIVLFLQATYGLRSLVELASTSFYFQLGTGIPIVAIVAVAG